MSGHPRSTRQLCSVCRGRGLDECSPGNTSCKSHGLRQRTSSPQTFNPLAVQPQQAPSSASLLTSLPDETGPPQGPQSRTNVRPPNRTTFGTSKSAFEVGNPTASQSTIATSPRRSGCPPQDNPSKRILQQRLRVQKQRASQTYEERKASNKEVTDRRAKRTEEQVLTDSKNRREHNRNRVAAMSEAEREAHYSQRREVAKRSLEKKHRSQEVSEQASEPGESSPSDMDPDSKILFGLNETEGTDYPGSTLFEDRQRAENPYPYPGTSNTSRWHTPEMIAPRGMTPTNVLQESGFSNDQSLLGTKDPGPWRNPYSIFATDDRASNSSAAPFFTNASTIRDRSRDAFVAPPGEARRSEPLFRFHLEAELEESMSDSVASLDLNKADSNPQGRGTSNQQDKSGNASTAAGSPPTRPSRGNRPVHRPDHEQTASRRSNREPRPGTYDLEQKSSKKETSPTPKSRKHRSGRR